MTAPLTSTAVAMWCGDCRATKGHNEVKPHTWACEKCGKCRGAHVQAWPEEPLTSPPMPTPPAAPIVALLVERESSGVVEKPGNGADAAFIPAPATADYDAHVAAFKPPPDVAQPVVMPGASTALQLRVNELEAEVAQLRETVARQGHALIAIWRIAEAGDASGKVRP